VDIGTVANGATRVSCVTPTIGTKNFDVVTGLGPEVKSRSGVC
jgi:hypothetical protein